MMRTVGVSAVTVAMTAAAMAQTVSPFNTDDCPERPGYRWCPSKASEAGWRLKYQSVSPANIADAWWDVEVWIRGHEAMLCEARSGRGRAPTSFCEPLEEVAE
jgi:hypothetical protein